MAQLFHLFSVCRTNCALSRRMPERRRKVPWELDCAHFFLIPRWWFHHDLKCLSYLHIRISESYQNMIRLCKYPSLVFWMGCTPGFCTPDFSGILSLAAFLKRSKRLGFHSGSWDVMGCRVSISKIYNLQVGRPKKNGGETNVDQIAPYQTNPL